MSQISSEKYLKAEFADACLDAADKKKRVEALGRYLILASHEEEKWLEDMIFADIRRVTDLLRLADEKVALAAKALADFSSRGNV